MVFERFFHVTPFQVGAKNANIAVVQDAIVSKEGKDGTGGGEHVDIVVSPDGRMGAADKPQIQRPDVPHKREEFGEEMK